ncbi:TetR/AcrR family transcriptional regulator [Lentilactobacillus sp. G22-6]|uniref:TetR/AcrR family transcriptional regulator n=1 Tax=Lentilactobacillus dabitei TaxID=2831523 RepID=UPI001C268B60|nr:TetR/AcrR family transcriptional regulator [Lentilactobacillus dabitei]MBU9790212.1 TetR/AcrR family transcriptional regulator [Lentilactobacillus dabitei]
MNGKQRIAKQSKEWLTTAFFELLKRQPYGEITVKDISEQAQLSRRTFYRSFKDKEDLLDDYGNRMIHAYLARLTNLSRANMDFEQVLTTFFSFWYEQRNEIRLLIKQNLFMVLLAKLSPQATKLYDVFQSPWHIEGTKREISYVMSFSFGGFWNILNMWLIEENPDSPKEVAHTLLIALKKMNYEE